jgi:hypothetical protein
MANMMIAEEETAATFPREAAIGMIARPCYGAHPQIEGSLGAAVARAAADQAWYGTPRRPLRYLRWSPAYALSAFVGLITYAAYGTLNQAWTNPALVAIGFFLFLTTPLYSKYSNRIEAMVARLTALETGGRIARFLFQLLDNLFLLWVFVAGEVIDPAGLAAIGGFFATAAWITIISQGGQYLANALSRRGLGHPDRNVVVAFAISASVSALAVSGVTWVQPIFILASLGFGASFFGIGLVIDARRLLDRRGPWR